MVDDEVKELHKGIQEVLVAIGKIQVEIQHLSSMAIKVEETQRTVIQLEQSVKSAHKRLDELKLTVQRLETSLAEEEKEKKADKKWIWALIIPSIISTISLIISLYKK